MDFGFPNEVPLLLYVNDSIELVLLLMVLIFKFGATLDSIFLEGVFAVTVLWKFWCPEVSLVEIIRDLKRFIWFIY